MNYSLTITEAALQWFMNELLPDPTRIRVCQAGISSWSGHTGWLLHNTDPRLASDSPHSSPVIVTGAARESEFDAALSRSLNVPHHHASMVALILGLGEALGQVVAVGQTCDDARPVDLFRVVAAGMPGISLDKEGVTTRSLASGISRVRSIRDDALTSDAIWSRSIGALGEEAWQRMSHVHAGIVGCGRTGSLVASSLARNGIGKMTFVDPDRLEPHNLGEMDAVDVADLGKPKVAVIARSIKEQDLVIDQSTTVVVDTILSFSALLALKPTDIIVCCVDNSAARWATACIAALYLKPLLDLGTGIFINPNVPQRSQIGENETFERLELRQMGADVRLILPGRCLVCYGGIGGLERAREELLADAAIDSTSIPSSPNWREQRAGSLRSLNGLAVSLGLHLLEDFVAARLRDNAWLHVEFSDQGIASIEHRHPRRATNCSLCSLAGRGDDGLGEVHGLLSSPDFLADRQADL